MNSSIKYLEHVVIHVSLQISIDNQYAYPDYYGEDYIYDNPFIIFFKGPRRGAITIDLRSPQGTYSYLLPKRKYDFVNSEGYRNWPFTSVQHWSEDPNGIWNITVQFHAEGGHIEMSNLSMTLYGTEDIPQSVRHIQCDENCARGCSYGEGSQYCDECRDLRMSDSLLCVSRCPKHYCNVAGYCQECPPLSAGLIAIAVIIPVTVVGALISGVIITGILVYWRWRHSEGYTEF